MNGLGRGQWRACTGTHNGKTVYGVWTNYQSDLVCITPDKHLGVGCVALRLVRHNDKAIPTKLDHVRYTLDDDGKYPHVDKNAELDLGHCHLLHEIDPALSAEPPTECTVSLAGDLSGLGSMMLGKIKSRTQLRIGLIDGNWQDRGFNDSRFYSSPWMGFGRHGATCRCS